MKNIKDKILNRNKTVYILGTSNSLEFTPWDKKDADYWACWPVVTEKQSFGHRLDAVFEIHEEKTWQNYKDHIKDFLSKHPETIFYMQRHYPEIERSIEFPISYIQDSIKNELLKRYFTNTIAYMLAYAIYLGYETINIYGVSLSVEEEEYSMQRSCGEAWICYGLGRNVTINICQPSALLSTNYMYGYEGNKDIIIKLIQTKDGVKMALDELAQKTKQAEMELATQQGAMNMLDYLIKSTFKGANNE